MDIKLKYCGSCLNKERQLYPVTNMYTIFQNISFWELLSWYGGICWECRKKVENFSKFKSQITQAQDSLKSANENPDIKCLSTLSYKTKSTYDYEYTYSPDPLKNAKSEVKIEALSDIIDTYSGDDDDGKNEDVLYDIQPLENSQDIYIGNIDIKETKIDIKVRKKERLKKLKVSTDKVEVVKFSTVVLTEEEMMKYREEKKNQPNYKKIPYKCDTCVLGFIKKENFDLHIEKKHDEVRTMFSSGRLWGDDDDEKVGDYICPVCQVRFMSKRLCDRHKQRHYMSYRCRECQYECLEMRAAFNHCRTQHGEGGVLRCTVCHATQRTVEELAQHMKDEHYCSECGGKFKGLSTLRSHKRRVHGVKREFACDICHKTFNTKSRLESHMAHHNAAIAQRLAYCARCDIQYKNIYVYRNHLRTSANHAHNTYQCRDCDKRFASKVYWKKHYNFYHLHKSQYHCDLCNKLFISQWRLKNHRETQHGMSRSRDHRCDVCGKQFFTLSTLKGHQLTHSEQRSFMCEDCGDTFKQRPALYTHYKLVHKGLKRRKKV